MTVRGKEITDTFYRRSASKAYFAGCSTGGQNALMEAQRFPDDYNGILAGAAAFNRTHLHEVNANTTHARIMTQTSQEPGGRCIDRILTAGRCSRC